MVLTQDYDDLNFIILMLLIGGAVWWSIDFILFATKNYNEIKKKNEYIANSFKCFNDLFIYVHNL